MNDLSRWKIVELHRRDNGKNTWYFGIQKPDGKRLYANTPAGMERTMYTVKFPLPVTIKTADGSRVNGTATLKVEALSEAGAIRKIMRYLDALATDWNLREEIKNTGPKQVNFDKRKVDIIPADRQLEAGPAGADATSEPVKPNKQEEKQRKHDESIRELYERMYRRQ